MAITQDDFKKVWASTSSVPEYTFSDSDYQDGWEFVGNLPPTRAMWDTLQRRNDQKMKYLQDNGSMCFDSVADMKSSNLDAGQTAFTKGYHDINDGGAGTYSIRGKVAGETEDGGSVIFLANGNVAELIVTGEVNINQFGGVGDGTTDDNVAIVNAVAYASKKNCRLVFLEGYTYYSSQPIVIENPPTEIRMDGALYYTGSGTALTIGSSSAAIENRVLKLNVVGSETHTAGSKGVILYNFNNSQIYLYKVQYFGDTAVTYCGNTKGFAYNTTVIGKVFSAPVCLKLTNIGSGWCNENKFYGGRFGTYSQDTFRSSAIGILITSDSDNYSQNANVFYSPSLEIATGVKIERGQYNFFYDCRTEGSVYPILCTGDGSKSIYNFMSSSYGYYDYSASSGNIYNGGNHLLEEKMLSNVIFDSGIIADNLASDGTRVGFAKLIHIDGNSNTTNKYIRGISFSIVDGKLNITNGTAKGSIGAIIDTTKNKMVYAQFIASGTGRRVVAMWDADGNIITDEGPKYQLLNGQSLGTLNLISNRQFYNMGSNVLNSEKYLIILPDKCAKAFIGIGGTDIIFERMIITGAYPATYETLQNYETAVLDTIPTSVGKVGQFVKKTTPTQGEIGWVYDGNQWLAVG